MSDVARGTWPDALAFPRMPAHLVPRPQQLRRLDRLAPLTVIETLPGFGKTTLAASWAHELEAVGGVIVWVRVTEELDDAETFLDVLHRGLVLAGALPESADRDTSLDQPERADELAQSERLVMVVVDDAHLLRDPSVAEALVALVGQAPPLHVLALADTHQTLSRAAGRHGLETNLLRASDLGIAVDELRAFADSWGHELSDERAKVLHEMIGGWLLPLRLVLDATPSWSADFATHAAHEFLVNRVLPELADTADTSRTMRLAVPRWLDVSMAGVLLEPSDGGSSAVRDELAALELRGLLWRVPRDDGAVRWRYPMLLRRALAERLERTDPDAARAAHCAVARELSRTRPGAGSAELLRHARSGNDWALLARLWADSGWSLAGGDPAAFEFAYATVPSAARQQHPSLQLAAALGDALTVTSHEDADWMHRVETLLRQYMETGSDLLQSRQQVRSPTLRAELLTAGMLARRSEGNMSEARTLAGEAERELRRARLVEPDRVPRSTTAWFHLQHAITQYLSGNFASALEEARAAHQIGPSTLVGAGAAGLLALIHATAGHTADARHWLASHQSVDLEGYWAAPLAQLPGRLTRAMLALDRLDEETAAAELSEVQLGPEASGLWPMIVLAHHRYALIFGDPISMLSRLQNVRRVLARHFREGGVANWVVDRCNIDLLLAMGQVNRVQARLGGSQSPSPWLLAPTARFHRMTGRPQQAARVAAAAVWRDDISVRDRAELLVTSSLAYRELGSTDRALKSFHRAHALCTDTGNLQPLLLMTAEARRELLDATGLALPPEVQARLDAAGPIYPEHVELVELSPRELEVLRQIQHHDTAASLARTLSVSVNTVKKQLVSLYVKLDVSDRSSALLRAQALGILHDPDDSNPHDAD